MTTFLANAAELEQLTTRLSDAGVRPIIVPCEDTVAATLIEFAARAAFPDYFGHNLDALVDCLRDLSATVICVNTSRLRTADRHGYEQIVDVLRQADADNPELTTFVAP